MNSYQKENRDYQKIKEEYTRISEEFDKTVREGGNWGELVEAYFNSVLGVAEATRQEKAVLLNTSEYDEELENINNNEMQIEEENKQLNEEKIVVHICGCVNKEGVIELNKNSRIADAIEMAGGLNNDADISQINLAYILEDGMKIIIPNKNEKVYLL